MLNYLLLDDCAMFHSYQIHVFCILQGDGDKKIELKPGYMMEHDEDVSIQQNMNIIITLTHKDTCENL